MNIFKTTFFGVFFAVSLVSMNATGSEKKPIQPNNLKPQSAVFEFVRGNINAQKMFEQLLKNNRVETTDLTTGLTTKEGACTPKNHPKCDYLHWPID